MKPLIAVVLAGGVGTRFWPISSDKIITNFSGRPLLSHSVFDSLPSAVEKIVIVTNPLNVNTIQAYKSTIPMSVVVQKKPLGMADALLTALPHIMGARLLIYIADDIIDPDLPEQVLEKADKSGAFAVLPGWRTPAYQPLGYFKLGGDHIRKIVEKPEPGKQPSEYVNISAHYISDSDIFLKLLARSESDTDDRYERTMSEFAERSEVLMLPYEGPYASLKYPWHILDVMGIIMNREIRSFRGKGSELRDSVVIDGDVHIGSNTKIFGNIKIIGPSYIGNNVVIGDNCLIRHSQISDNCVVGFKSEIARSYIGPNCWFHANYIGDSVLESDISMGYGAVLANFRLDETEISSIVKGDKINTGKMRFGSIIGRGVRIGVNVSVMPGVKIGTGSFIGSGAVVDRDVGDSMFYALRQNLEMRPNSKTLIPGTRDAFRNDLPK